MKYDTIIKQLLEGNYKNDGGGHSNWTFSSEEDNATKRSKSITTHEEAKIPKYSPEEVDEMWKDYEDIIGKAIFHNSNELKYYMGITDKILVVLLKPHFAVAFPAEIVLQMLEGKLSDVLTNIHKNYNIYRNINELANTSRATYGNSGIIGVSPFNNTSLDLPKSGQQYTNETAYLFDRWLSWLDEKRNDGWIIAGIDNKDIPGI
jgi:hypothetical protein